MPDSRFPESQKTQSFIAIFCCETVEKSVDMWIKDILRDLKRPFVVQKSKQYKDISYKSVMAL
jgi:hypothetical protein